MVVNNEDLVFFFLFFLFFWWLLFRFFWFVVWLWMRIKRNGRWKALLKGTNTEERKKERESEKKKRTTKGNKQVPASTNIKRRQCSTKDKVLSRYSLSLSLSISLSLFACFISRHVQSIITLISLRTRGPLSWIEWQFSSILRGTKRHGYDAMVGTGWVGWEHRRANTSARRMNICGPCPAKSGLFFRSALSTTAHCPFSRFHPNSKIRW